MITSGREGRWVWTIRQLTGKPFVTRGYVGRDKLERTCGHDHRKAVRAQDCAQSQARRLARLDNQEEHGG